MIYAVGNSIMHTTLQESNIKHATAMAVLSYGKSENISDAAVDARCAATFLIRSGDAERCSRHGMCRTKQITRTAEKNGSCRDMGCPKNPATAVCYAEPNSLNLNANWRETMKCLMTGVLPYLAVTLLTSAIYAQPPGDRQGPGGMGPHQGHRGMAPGMQPGPGGMGGPPMGFPPPIDPLFKALDTNNDGEISVKEIEAAVTSLKKLDKNGDGKLTHDELRRKVDPDLVDLADPVLVDLDQVAAVLAGTGVWWSGVWWTRWAWTRWIRRARRWWTARASCRKFL